jgi:hypothetical protein
VKLRGGLQHVVIASTEACHDATALRGLGHVVSHYVAEPSGPLPSEPEHSSFYVFRSLKMRPAHHCYETSRADGMTARPGRPLGKR